MRRKLDESEWGERAGRSDPTYRVVVGFAVGVATLVLTTTAGGGALGHDASQLSETAPRIVFQRGESLWITKLDGTSTRILAKRGGQPAVSPDGRRIAFVRSESIWVMARDGSGQRRLTSGHRDVSPEWSPDGRSLYFMRFVGKDGKYGFTYAYPIFRMSTDGSGATQITRPVPSDDGTCHDAPSVAPNGRVIAYGVFDDCDHGVPAGIQAVDPSGKRVPLRGFDLPGDGFSPDWSPDGRRLAFAFGAFPDPPGLGTAAAGSSSTTLYKGQSESPSWSPDGRWIAFTRGGSRGTIWLVRPDGRDLRRVTSTPSDGHPAWLPPRRT